MEKGKLYIVSTPIGNLKDITKRALDVLSKADIIASEDTRTTGNLLKLLGIYDKILFSYYKHKEDIKGKKLIEILESGKNVALVSDAGTPNISDPGIGILKEAYKRDIKIVPIPGPSSLCTAISVSPFSGNYLFVSFPPKGRKKIQFFKEKIRGYDNLIFMESPKRVLDTLNILSQISPERELLCLKELTKMYEEIILDRCDKIYEIFKNRENIKGEFIFILKGKEECENISMEKIFEKFEILKKEGYSHKESVKIISLLMDVSRNKLYKLLLKDKK